MLPKKVIFVGGSSYSGSTFLDMMLASGDGGFSAGEVQALFYPRRPWHINPRCGCGDSACAVWQDIKRKGVANLYQEIFKRFPEVHYIVDSSKNPIWIARHSKFLMKKGIDVQRVLIYKTPLEFARSRLKRSHLKGWERAWKNYYKLYFSMIDSWVTIKYSNIAAKPSEYLEKLCKEIGLNYFKSKELYWNFRHHTLFGNESAKIHLYSEKSDIYEKCVRNLARQDNSLYDNKYRTIYYNGNFGDKLSKEIAHVTNLDSEINLILDLLKATEVGLRQNLDKIARLNTVLRIPSYISYLYKGRDLYRRILSRIYAVNMRK